MGMYFACMNTLALEWGFPCLPKIIKHTHTHTHTHKITHWSNATALCHHVHHDRSSICVMLASFPFGECIACVQCLATAAADSLLDATTVQLSSKAKKKTHAAIKRREIYHLQTRWMFCEWELFRSLSLDFEFISPQSTNPPAPVPPIEVIRSSAIRFYVVPNSPRTLFWNRGVD